MLDVDSAVFVPNLVVTVTEYKQKTYQEVIFIVHVKLCYQVKYENECYGLWTCLVQQEGFSFWIADRTDN